MSTAHQANIPYPTYRDSGVDWLGEIPEHWGVVPLKRLVKEHSGNGFPIELQGEHGDIPFFKVSDFSQKNIVITEAVNYVSSELVKKQKWNLVPKNSLVTAKIGEALRKNHRKILGKESVIDNNCIAFEVLSLDLKYNFYLHQIIDFDWFTNPGAVPSISVTKYKSEKVPVPPLPEQQRIIKRTLANHHSNHRYPRLKQNHPPQKHRRRLARQNPRALGGEKIKICCSFAKRRINYC